MEYLDVTAFVDVVEWITYCTQDWRMLNTTMSLYQRVIVSMFHIDGEFNY